MDVRTQNGHRLNGQGPCMAHIAEDNRGRTELDALRPRQALALWMDTGASSTHRRSHPYRLFGTTHSDQTCHFTSHSPPMPSPLLDDAADLEFARCCCYTLSTLCCNLASSRSATSRAVSVPVTAGSFQRAAIVLAPFAPADPHTVDCFDGLRHALQHESAMHDTWTKLPRLRIDLIST